MSGIDNPYWDLVKDRVDPHGSLWRTPSVDSYGRYSRADVDGFLTRVRPATENGTDRRTLAKRFSWTITDPDTLAFVVEHSAGRLVDPMAGTGYWGFCLAQLGIDVVSYDIEPGTNTYHDGQPLHCTVNRLNGIEAAAMHPTRTLFLSWPPMDEAGADILTAYHGDRVIHIGEGEGGCTGDERLFEALAKDWTEIASHVPVQWDGIHDVVTVYTRGGAS